MGHYACSVLSSASKIIIITIKYILYTCNKCGGVGKKGEGKVPWLMKPIW